MERLRRELVWPRHRFTAERGGGGGGRVKEKDPELSGGKDLLPKHGPPASQKYAMWYPSSSSSHNRGTSSISIKAKNKKSIPAKTLHPIGRLGNLV